MRRTRHELFYIAGLPAGCLKIDKSFAQSLDFPPYQSGTSQLAIRSNHFTGQILGLFRYSLVTSAQAGVYCWFPQRGNDLELSKQEFKPSAVQVAQGDLCNKDRRIRRSTAR